MPRSTRRKFAFVLGGVGIFLLIVVGLSFTGIQRLSFDEIEPVKPTRPGDVATIVLPEFGGEPTFWYEQAPLGLWFNSHDETGRIAQHWWSSGGHTRFFFPEVALGISEVEVLVPDDARGSVVAVCDIADNCFKVPLASD